jgi:DEAD/DEAH box helicase domain-containing protein
MSLYLLQQQGIYNTLWTKQIVGESRVTLDFTISGKSLIYQIPVLESLLRNKNNKAIYLFPTKALAQDQKRAFQALLYKISNLGDIKVYIIDNKKILGSLIHLIIRLIRLMVTLH